MFKSGLFNTLSGLVKPTRLSQLFGLSRSEPEVQEPVVPAIPEVEPLESRIKKLVTSLDRFDRTSFEMAGDDMVFKCELVIPILADRGDLEFMKEIVDAYPGINLTKDSDYLGLSSLKNAILTQNEEVVDFLLDEVGVNPLVDDPKHFFLCPLLAASTGNYYGTQGSVQRLFMTQDLVDQSTRITEKLLDVMENKFEGDQRQFEFFVLNKSYSHNYSGSTKTDYWGLRQHAHPTIWKAIEERVSGQDTSFKLGDFNL